MRVQLSRQTFLAKFPRGVFVKSSCGFTVRHWLYRVSPAAQQASLVLWGKQRLQIASPSSDDQFGAELSADIYPEESMSKSILMKKRPPEKCPHSLPNSRAGQSSIVKLNVLETADIEQ